MRSQWTNRKWAFVNCDSEAVDITDSVGKKGLAEVEGGGQKERPSQGDNGQAVTTLMNPPSRPILW